MTRYHKIPRAFRVDALKKENYLCEEAGQEYIGALRKQFVLFWNVELNR